jgi:hypothetical protein
MSAPTANEITNLLLVEIPRRFPQARVWRVNSFAAKMPNGRLVTSGPKGLADISGIIGPFGQRLEVEVKGPGDRVRKEQQSFAVMVESHGGIHLFARDVETTIERLGQAIAARTRVARDEDQAVAEMREALSA